MRFERAPSYRVYIGLTVAAAAGIGAILFVRTMAGPPPDGRMLLVAAIVLAASFFLHARPFTIPWRGERIAVHCDEALVVVALLDLPGWLVVLVCALAMLASQLYLRKARVKVVFNTAMSVVTVALAMGAAALVAAWTGAEHLAALVAAPVLAASSQLVVAGLLGTMDGRGWAGVLGERSLARSILVLSLAGLLLGALGMGLHAIHPVASLLLAPLAYLVYRLLAAEYLHETELETRRLLAEASARLVGETSAESIAGSLRGVLSQALDLRGLEVSMSESPHREWRWGAADHGGTVRIVVPLRTDAGATLGELRVIVGDRGRRKRADDAALASLVASYLSMAIAGASALRAAREAEERLREAFAAAVDAIAVVDGAGRVVHANPVARRALGLADGDDVVARLAGSLDAATASALPRAMTDGGVTTLAAETTDGTRRAYEFRLSPLMLPDGEPGSLLVARDVTDRVRLEEEAARQRELAARNERLSAVGTLVAGVAHEVNSPLSYVTVNLQMAIEDLADAPPALQETREQLRVALTGVERVAAITGALRVMARQRRVSAGETFDASAALRELSPLLAASLPDGVELEVRPPDAPANVRGVASEIQQAVTALVRNAGEAAAPTGHVGVAATVRDGRLLIHVVDDGPGLTSEARAHLFNPFYTTKPDGTGLGLTLALRVVRDHGGEIEVESDPGKGARFTIVLPLAA